MNHDEVKLYIDVSACIYLRVIWTYVNKIHWKEKNGFEYTAFENAKGWGITIYHHFFHNNVSYTQKRTHFADSFATMKFTHFIPHTDTCIGLMIMIERNPKNIFKTMKSFFIPLMCSCCFYFYFVFVIVRSFVCLLVLLYCCSNTVLYLLGILGVGIHGVHVINVSFIQ